MTTGAVSAGLSDVSRRSRGPAAAVGWQGAPKSEDGLTVARDWDFGANPPQGIVNAAGEIGITIPLVVRLEGNNVEKGRKILNDAAGSRRTLQAATDLRYAGEKVVRAVG